MDADKLRRETTSAMVDGAASDEDIDGWLAAWSTDAQQREDWHLYHLIGDTLRSSELAGDAARDMALLQGVRRAMAQEPTVLAPAALPVRRRVHRRLWSGTAAALAGVALVTASYIGTRVDVDGPTLGGLAGGFSATPWAQEDIRRASVVGLGGAEALATGSAVAQQTPGPAFREILRLPRGPAARPYESVQVLYSDGSATISVELEPFREGEHVPRAEQGDRLNTLSLHRQGTWITLTGDVPLSTLHQFAGAVQPVR